MAVARSDVVRDEEYRLETFALLATQLDGWVRLDAVLVQWESARQLRVPPSTLKVSRLSGATFLLLFDTQQQRNAARLRGSVRFGHTGLQLLPWTRHVGASSDLARFNFHVRPCIEGVPSHARFAQCIASLLSPTSFIDDEFCDAEKPEEEDCFRLWLWTRTPEDIAMTGTLDVEEPVTMPQEGYVEYEMGMPMGAMRIDAAEALTYEVIIHVDRVLDYSPLPDSPSHQSVHSPTSGLPDEFLEEEWPVGQSFTWSLGVPDGNGRRSLVRRVSVHDRLGDRGRDRSLPRGGGGSGSGLPRGFHQFPPSGPHDLPGLCGGDGGSHTAGGRHGAGRHHYKSLPGSVFSRLGPLGGGPVVLMLRKLV